MSANGRAWVGTITYPGLKPAVFGTVYVRLGAPMQEVEQALIDAAHQHLPAGFVLANAVPGSLVFIPEDA